MDNDGVRRVKVVRKLRIRLLQLLQLLLDLFLFLVVRLICNFLALLEPMLSFLFDKMFHGFLVWFGAIGLLSSDQALREVKTLRH